MPTSTRAVETIKDRLDCTTAVLQLPIGAEGDYAGVIDLVTMKALVWLDEELGAKWEVQDIPADLRRQGRGVPRRAARDRRLRRTRTLLEKFLDEEEITDDELRAAIRKATLAGEFVPVLNGTAFKNKGVQPLLDAVVVPALAARPARRRRAPTSRATPISSARPPTTPRSPPSPSRS